MRNDDKEKEVIKKVLKKDIFDTRYEIRVASQELEDWRAAARAEGKTLPAWIRSFLPRELVKA